MSSSYVAQMLDLCNLYLSDYNFASVASRMFPCSPTSTKGFFPLVIRDDCKILKYPRGNKLFGMGNFVFMFPRFNQSEMFMHRLVRKLSEALHAKLSFDYS